MTPQPSAELTARVSLRARVLWKVLVPLGLTWVLGSALTLGIAYVHARQALDRSLLDDAYAIAANVAFVAGQPVLQLSDREVGTVLFDPSERVFFAVLRQDGSFVAGHGGLREGPLDAASTWTFADLHRQGLDLRTVTLRREQPGPFAVVVAQTVSSRRQLLGQLITVSLVPQILLLAALGWWLRRSVGQELEPLARLQRALDQRHASDLSPVAVQAPSRDVHHLADAANRLMARVASGVQAQREFTGNVAHELRTPLAGIRSLAEHGLAQADPEQWRAQLQRILQSEQRASHLVEQLLALALADEARDTVVLEPLAVDAVVRDLLLRLMPRADAAGVDLGATGLEQPVWALAHRALLEGLLNNLLDNAFRYGRPTHPDHPPQVTVEVAADTANARVRISVSDNGPGLDEASRERVLQRGAQGAAGQALGVGGGLGLAIVARYAELLRGRIELSGAEDAPGLRVSLTLPSVQPSPREA